MVADQVTVESIPATTTTSTTTASATEVVVVSEGESGKVHRWSSDGTGEFTIEEVDPTTTSDTTSTPPLKRGSRIILKIKDTNPEYYDNILLKNIIQKYSNFVSFPIYINNELINSITALWSQDKKTITNTQYNEFYKFISNAYDEPRYISHYTTDAPIDLKVLLYIPYTHSEKFGGGQMERGMYIHVVYILCSIYIY